MGSIFFESWNATIDNIEALNIEQEISRIQLIFEEHGGGYVWAKANGNVSAYYVIVQELLKHFSSGEFICEVELSSGNRLRLKISNHYVNEDGNDISFMFFNE